MPGIEYSPNARASCQGCRCKIPKGNVRVSVKAQSPYSRGGRHGISHGYFSGECITKYYHAECYRNMKDFTKFYGFYSLEKEDQYKYLTKEQREKIFGPDDLVTKALSSIPEFEYGDASFLDNYDVDAAVAATRPNLTVGATTATTTTTTNGNDAATTTPEQEPVKKKAKVLTTKQQESYNITITGLKYAQTKAKPNEKIKLRREPENVSWKASHRVCVSVWEREIDLTKFSFSFLKLPKKYDSNAVLVLNEEGQKLGHLRKEMAPKFSTLLLSLADKNLTLEGQITGHGDAYTQPARVKIVKMTMPPATIATTTAAAATSNRNVAVPVTPSSNKKPATKKGTTTATKKKKQESYNITISGLKYAEARGEKNEKIKLRREPENVCFLFC